jgi:hypothetical protein
MGPLPRLLLVQSIAFAIASVVHSGTLVRVSVDSSAMTAEGIIAAVLFAGFVISLLWPRWTRLTAGIVQAFALAGSLIGLYLAIRGVGPDTPLDLVFHVLIVLMLVAGLVAVIRAPGASSTSQRRSAA